MPLKGFKTITVSEEVYREVEGMAKRNHRSVSNQTEFLIYKGLSKK